LNIEQAYERTNAVKPEGTVTPLTFEEAEKAIRKMFRHLKGRRFPYRIVETSGNRYTWLRGSEFRVNVGNGWSDLIHLFSHWFHREYVGGRPHSKKHARLEKNLRKWAVARGWFNGSLKPKPKEPKPEPVAAPVDFVAKREAKARRMLAKWERKLELAKGHLQKWRAKVRYYDRKKTASA